MGIGKRIAELRRENNITQKELAMMLGTTFDNISDWESETKIPDINSVVLIGEKFEISMDYLLLDKKPNNVSGPKKNNQSIYIMIAFCFVSLLGIILLLLTPLLATFYQNYISGYEPAYTNANLYLTEWPMLGIVFSGVITTLSGLGGLLLVFVKKYTRKF